MLQKAPEGLQHYVSYIKLVAEMKETSDTIDSSTEAIEELHDMLLKFDVKVWLTIGCCSHYLWQR